MDVFKLRSVLFRKSLEWLCNKTVVSKTYDQKPLQNLVGNRRLCICCRAVVNTSQTLLRSNRSQNRSLLLQQQRIFSSTGDVQEKTERLTDEEIKILRELEEEEAKAKEDKLRGSMSQDFVTFENNQRVIQDVIEEMWNPMPEEEPAVYEIPEQFVTRGKFGVFDLGELVDLLRNENGKEIVSISIPKELDYADQMVIVTATNPRHLLAMADYVRKRFKMKSRKPSDVIPSIVTKDGRHGWIALDLGNIILHLFLQTQRDYYDLEMLWTVGPLFDDLCNMKDPEIIQLLNTLK